MAEERPLRPFGPPPLAKGRLGAFGPRPAASFPSRVVFYGGSPKPPREGPLRPLAGPPPHRGGRQPLSKEKKRGALGAFLLQRPPNPQMRLKYGVFRHLRMAAKGSALRTRHLLKKVDENFWISENFAVRLPLR